MKVRVECHAGYRGDEEPRAVTLGDTRLAIVDIVDRWLAPDHRYFKVKAQDGRTLVLRHDTVSDDWEFAGLGPRSRAAPSAARCTEG